MTLVVEKIKALISGSYHQSSGSTSTGTETGAVTGGGGFNWSDLPVRGVGDLNPGEKLYGLVVDKNGSVVAIEPVPVDTYVDTNPGGGILKP